MTNEDRIKTLKNMLKIISSVALIYSLVICAILVMSYYNLQKYSPIESERTLMLLQKIDKDPQNQDLREAYRSLDMVSRKAFFVSNSQIETGKILLIIGLVVFFLCKQLSILLEKPKFSVNSQKNNTKLNSLALKHISVLVLIVLMLIPTFIFSYPEPKTGPEIEKPSDSSNQTVNNILSLKEDTQGYWNSFRNMGRTYTSSHSFPLSWNAETGKNIVWKKELELPGFNSPVQWGEHIYITGANEETFRVECREHASGKQLWKYDIKIEDTESLPEVQDDTGYAAPTPAASKNGIFSIFANGMIVALDHDGKKLWTKQLNVPDNHYGHSSSLLTYSGMLFVQFDTNEEKYICAYNEMNGDEIWKTERTGEISWTSPILVEWNSNIYLLLNSNPFVSAYNPLTGKSIWETECLSGEVAPSLAFSDGIVCAAQAYAGVFGLNIETGKQMWDADGELPDVSSPVSSGKILIIPSTYGTITAINVANATKYWIYEQDDGFYSSPVIVNNRIYISDIAGRTIIFEVSDQMKKLGEGIFPEPVYATPAFTEKGIVFRTATMLYLVDGGVK